MIETENPLDVHDKVKWICQEVKTFDLCINNCSESFEKSTLLNSFGHWTAHCSLLTKPTKTIMDYFTCERNHLLQTKVHCGEMKIVPHISLSLFCRNFDKYRKCYTDQPHNCTSDALEIKTLIDDALLMSFDQLLKINSNRVYIPAQCFSWRRYRLRHHGRRRKKEKEEKLIAMVEENLRATTEKDVQKQELYPESLKSTEDDKNSTTDVKANLETVTVFAHIRSGTDREFTLQYPEINNEEREGVDGALVDRKMPLLNKVMKSEKEATTADTHNLTRTAQVDWKKEVITASPYALPTSVTRGLQHFSSLILIYSLSLTSLCAY